MLWIFGVSGKPFDVPGRPLVVSRNIFEVVGRPFEVFNGHLKCLKAIQSVGKDI